MTQGTFYLMQSNSTEQDLRHFICQLVKQHYQQQKRVYLHCGTRTQAHEMDDLLWSFESETFIPHNLKGEGLKGGSPVEIGFDQQAQIKDYDILINLADQAPAFAVNFPQIIDFVAADETKKAIARDRFRQYRSMSIELNTQDQNS
ncbi:MAG: DNA polymerase III subunit chi [Parashewanella sp.]